MYSLGQYTGQTIGNSRSRWLAWGFGGGGVGGGGAVSFEMTVMGVLIGEELTSVCMLDSSYPVHSFAAGPSVKNFRPMYPTSCLLPINIPGKSQQGMGVKGREHSHRNSQ
jgi:hypothetical protein